MNHGKLVLMQRIQHPEGNSRLPQWQSVGHIIVTRVLHGTAPGPSNIGLTFLTLLEHCREVSPQQCMLHIAACCQFFRPRGGCCGNCFCKLPCIACNSTSSHSRTSVDLCRQERQHRMSLVRVAPETALRQVSAACALEMPLEWTAMATPAIV